MQASNHEQSPKDLNTPKAKLTSYVLNIEGMFCAACSSRIEKVLSTTNGVQLASVNLVSAKLNLSYDSSIITLEAIFAKVANMGFKLLMPEADEDLLATSRKRQTEQTQRLKSQAKLLIPNLALALPLLIFSMGDMVGLELPSFVSGQGSPKTFALIQFLLCTPLLWIGRNFYIVGFRQLIKLSPNMDSLVAVGTGSAYLYSLWSSFIVWFGEPMNAMHGMAGHLTGNMSGNMAAHLTGAVGELYYESAAVLLAMISLGKYLEARSTHKAGNAIESLLLLTPESATKILPNKEELQVAINSLEIGDHILIRPGERIPVDGFLLSGKSSVDESMLTGESLAIFKELGDKLIAGSLNKSGSFVMQAEKIGANTALARIAKMVQEAQGSKPELARLADQISLYFVPSVMVLALLSGIFWFFYADTSLAIKHFVAVLVIACPCAMGLAVPTAVMVASGRAAQLGILVRNGAALESGAKIDTIIMDKTGTLTEGKTKLQQVILLQSDSKQSSQHQLDWQKLSNIAKAYQISLEDLILLSAAALERNSEHPLAEAIVEAGHKIKEQNKLVDFNGIELIEGTFNSVAGKGVYANLKLSPALTALNSTNEPLESFELRLACGNQLFSEEEMQSSFSPELAKQIQNIAELGQTPLILCINKSPAALLGIADSPREEAQSIIAELQAMKLNIIMLTGDNPDTAKAICKILGIDDFRASLLPGDKANIIKELQEQNKQVAMIGDGVNDAPALAQANLGLAMGSGMDVAIEAGDLVLLRPGLSALPTALNLCRAAVSNIKQNLFWAFAYNILGIPVAAGILSLWGGPTLSPMLAGTAMALSSVSVVSNALRLRYFK